VKKLSWGKTYWRTPRGTIPNRHKGLVMVSEETSLTGKFDYFMEHQMKYLAKYFLSSGE
jgi:hypothetical protein